VLISFVLLVPVLHYAALLQTDVIFTYHPPWSVIRLLVLIIALLIFIKALLIDYDFLSFIGIRQILHFTKPSGQKSGGIKKTGLLGIVRHPLYFAVILALWCNTYRISDIVVNSVLTIYVFIGTILEERKLVLEFGDVYTQYKKEVPMLIPFANAFSNRKSSHPDN
jgi:protein-S-isoprenylcysteine O-methyltransferase Ste14